MIIIQSKSEIHHKLRVSYVVVALGVKNPLLGIFIDKEYKITNRKLLDKVTKVVFDYYKTEGDLREDMEKSK
jgi:hypothetical protein